MAQVTLTQNHAPHVTGYDSTEPTRQTELLNATINGIIEDMEDAGWSIADHNLPSTDVVSIASNIHDMIEDVFDYAKSGITNFRATGDPNLSKPLYTSIPRPSLRSRWRQQLIQWNVYQQCIAMMYRIYYLWETEEDPLRIKDYIRDMLLAWPLHDIEIQLNEEAGKSLRVYPVWKDADI